MRRRLANGEITTQEYEEKRAILLRDRNETEPRGGRAA
ncbi:MAG: SHOCT domain-containing protein [Terriglobales bacterium]